MKGASRREVVPVVVSKRKLRKKMVKKMMCNRQILGRYNTKMMPSPLQAKT